jgi:hypothetical protein
MKPDDTTEAPERSGQMACSLLPMTPALAEIMTKANLIAKRAGDRYCRISHVEAALGIKPPPPPEAEKTALPFFQRKLGKRKANDPHQATASK